MPSRLPDSIEVTGALPEGVEYLFPQRALGRARKIVWLVFGIVVVLACLPFGWLVWVLINNRIQILNQLFLIMPILFLALMIRSPLWYCLVALYGHHQVRLQADSLTVSNGFGTWTRSTIWPLSRLKRLQLVDPAASLAIDSPIVALVKPLSCLTGILDDGKRILIVPGYPNEIIAPFVEELTRQIAFARAESQRRFNTLAVENAFTNSTDDSPFPIHAQREDGNEVVSMAHEPSAIDNSIEIIQPIGLTELVGEARDSFTKSNDIDVFAQPKLSQVKFEWLVDGITIHVPPLGIRKGPAVLIWLGFVFICTSAIVAAFILVTNFPQPGGLLESLLKAGVISGIFGTVGGLMLYYGWKIATRETGLAIIGDKMIVLKTENGRTSQTEWPLNQIVTVRVGQSGFEVNDQPVLELQVIGLNGKLHGMLIGRDLDELQWMATLLRKAINQSRLIGQNNSHSAETEVGNF